MLAVGASAHLRPDTGLHAALAEDAERGVPEEGHAELSDLANRKPWDYGER